jgi:hypothetical protein
MDEGKWWVVWIFPCGHWQLVDCSQRPWRNRGDTVWQGTPIQVDGCWYSYLPSRMWFFQEKDGILCYGPRKYFTKMLGQFKNIIHHHWRKWITLKYAHQMSWMMKESKNTKQWLVPFNGQWAVSLGRNDIQTATMTMSPFRAVPRQGHLDRLKRMDGYLRKFASAAIRVKVFNALPEQEFDWCQSE